MNTPIKRNMIKLTLVGLFLPILALSCGLLTPATSSNVPVQPVQVVVATPVPPAKTISVIPSSEDATLVDLYARVNPAVVNITVFQAQNGVMVAQGQGSGFVYDTNGHVVTNAHVVHGSDQFEVTFSDGTSHNATVVGQDLNSDLAVLQVENMPPAIEPLTLGDMESLAVGQSVVAIGNPFGLDGSLTRGIISALGRTIPALTPFSIPQSIQTDAAINPGNSGGPLLNLNGEVIGINRAIFTTSSTSVGEPTSSGIGFAVSINIVKRVLPTLMAGKTYDYPYVGIFSLNDISIIQQEALGLKQTTGVYVTDVVTGSPADKAGVHAGDKPTDITGLNAGGDLITAIDGTPVDSFNEFISYLILNKAPGDKVTLTILRGAEEIKLEVTLEKRPSQ